MKRSSFSEQDTWDDGSDCFCVVKYRAYYYDTYNRYQYGRQADLYKIDLRAKSSTAETIIGYAGSAGYIVDVVAGVGKKVEAILDVADALFFLNDVNDFYDKYDVEEVDKKEVGKVWVGKVRTFDMRVDDGLEIITEPDAKAIKLECGLSWIDARLKADQRQREQLERIHEDRQMPVD